MSDEFTPIIFTGTAEQIAGIKKFDVEAPKPGAVYMRSHHAPYGHLLRDGDGDYCVRIAGDYFLSLGSDTPTWLTVPEGEIPFTVVDMEALHEDRDDLE